MIHNPPSIGIVIPFHNDWEYLYRAITSCLWQLSPYDELIVVDDGSTNGAGHNEIRKFRDRIMWLENKTCKGVSHSRNRAILRSKADWIKFLDADDLLAPCALDFMRHAMMQLPPTIQVVSGGCHRLIDGRYVDFLPGGEESLKSILHSNPLLPSATFVRRQALLDVGMFDERIDFEEDWDLWLKLHEKFGLGSFGITDQPICYYWIHQNERNLKARRYVVDGVPVREYFQKRYGVLAD